MAPKKMTKTGAQNIVARLEHIAELFEHHHELLNIEKKIATDFAYRCDLLSEAIEKTAGIDEEGTSVEPEGDDFDANAIGDEGLGALEGDLDEDYTKDNFTQQENQELKDKQEEGSLPHVDKAAKIMLRTVAAQLLRMAEDDVVEDDEFEVDAKEASAPPAYLFQ